MNFRASGDPVLYLSDPPGIDKATRRRMLDGIARLNQMNAEAYGDPEIETRIAQYEMAYRMQTSVPELMDLSKEPQSVFDMYGADRASRARMRRTACWRGVWPSEACVSFSFITAAGINTTIYRATLRLQCKSVDQPSAALIQDLKQRGLLDDTLVLWGGEFGRTVYCQGKLMETNYGRDHHPRCFSVWMAGGGIKPGITYGETDDFSYNVVADPVHVHDIQATILHCLGIDHKRLTFKFQGRHFRLTDVAGEVVRPLLA